MADRRLLARDLAVLWTEAPDYRCVLATLDRSYYLRVLRGAQVIKEDLFIDELQAFSMAREWRREIAGRSDRAAAAGRGA